MPCSITIRDDLALTDVRTLARSHLIEATPHTGNWTTWRLLYPSLPIRTVCVDHTIPCRDRNAHPHLLITQAGAHTLSSHTERLTTHAHVTHPNTSHQSGTSLSEVHTGTVRKLFPAAEVLTHTEYLRNHCELLLTCYESLISLSKGALFWRHVDESGTITAHKDRKRLPSTFSEVRDNIFCVTNETSGWLVHNRLAILLDMLVQSHMGEESVIYHLSGPDMVHYLESEQKILSRMYDHLRPVLGLRSEHLTIALIPFANMRFAVRESHGQEATRLCEALEAGETCRQTLQTHAARLPDIVSDTETTCYFSQHDLVSCGERIVVPEPAEHWSFDLCARHHSMLSSG